MTPSHLVIFLKGNLLQISSGLEVMFEFFVSPSLVCLEYLEMIVDFTDFGVLEFLWGRQNSLFLWIDSAWICRACYFWFLTWLEVSVLISVFIIFSCSFSFLADAVPFLFLFCFSRTLSRFFSCPVWFNPICWHLKLLAMALVSDVYFLSI